MYIQNFNRSTAKDKTMNEANIMTIIKKKEKKIVHMAQLLAESKAKKANTQAYRRVESVTGIIHHNILYEYI